MVAVLDIETARPTRAEWATIKGIDPQQNGEGSAEVERDYEKTVFDGTYGKIVCIGLLMVNEDMASGDAIAWYGSNEKSMLREFWKRVGAIQPDLIVTHNGLGFDLPFIRKRSMINQVKPSIDINLARFRSRPVFDTMAEWSNWDARNYTKLDVLARVLGVETKSGSGEQVASMWDRGEWEAVANYCLQDVYVTYACYCRMSYQEPGQSKDMLSGRALIRID